MQGRSLAAARRIYISYRPFVHTVNIRTCLHARFSTVTSRLSILMPARRLLIATLSWVIFLSLPGLGRQDDVNARIREEGFQRSLIMETLHHLTDVYGPRLTGSPTLERAGEWALRRMKSYGLVNAHTHAWKWGHPGWENETLVAHMVSPVKAPLVCEVVAWTPSTDGTVTASSVHLVPPASPTQAELDHFLRDIEAQVPGMTFVWSST